MGLRIRVYNLYTRPVRVYNSFLVLTQSMAAVYSCVFVSCVLVLHVSVRIRVYSCLFVCIVVKRARVYSCVFVRILCFCRWLGYRLGTDD